MHPHRLGALSPASTPGLLSVPAILVSWNVSGPSACELTAPDIPQSTPAPEHKDQVTCHTQQGLRCVDPQREAP